ncbi:hypothetical protein [Enterobacter kobei]|uniref:hypothetical protein n=1 Tax=Enterobacter kobei TaxID=208224 RepID=UPI002FD4856D
MTANKPMTGEQLDELMTVAVNMQHDSEKANDRPSAMFAYAVQIAVLELRKVRNDVAALAAENAGLNEKMNKLATWPGIEFYSSAWEFNNSDGNAALEYMCDTETPATDAFLAEVRAQGVEMFAESQNEYVRKNRSELDSMTRAAYCGSAVDAERFAAQLRKGVQS